mgnify:CR=1 FL=1
MFKYLVILFGFINTWAGSYSDMIGYAAQTLTTVFDHPSLSQHIKQLPITTEELEEVLQGATFYSINSYPIEVRGDSLLKSHRSITFDGKKCTWKYDTYVMTYDYTVDENQLIQVSYPGSLEHDPPFEVRYLVNTGELVWKRHGYSKNKPPRDHWVKKAHTSGYGIRVH